ncbi:MAG: glycerate kinase [Tenericutes bacterium]|nr:glycerate kinase [Mycoplasmatota bacterium]
MNIVAMIDSFKGTISSLEISLIIKQELEKKGHIVNSIPISDGGEGFIDSIKSHFSVDTIKVETFGPLGDSILCEYILKDDIAYIEMNSAAGLSLIRKDKLNPLLTSTSGVGKIIKDALKKGAKKIILGVGGSSTNDGGSGMLQTLGVKFYNEGKLIVNKMNGELIGKVTSIDITKLQEVLSGIEFEIASDVKNPLLGKNGSAYIYSPQKGANQTQVQLLEENMKSFSKVVESHFGKDFSNENGAGAAGGIGFGCLAFLNAEISSGIGMMIELLNLEESIKKSSVLIVGEGKLDNQTKYGKAPSGLAKLAKKHNKKVIGVFALIEKDTKCDYLDNVMAIVPKYATMKESTGNPAKYFTKMIRDLKID